MTFSRCYASDSIPLPSNAADAFGSHPPNGRFYPIS